MANAEKRVNLTTKSPDQSDGSTNPSDMNRRLKNRERQRRYRARKKMEADKYKSPSPQEPQQSAAPSTPPFRRIRNWKQDARDAAARRLAESMKTEHSLRPDSNIEEDGTENLCPWEYRKIEPFRRNWKRDARNKKSEVVDVVAEVVADVVADVADVDAS